MFGAEMISPAASDPGAESEARRVSGGEGFDVPKETIDDAVNNATCVSA